jgi:hypothetical protein
VVEKCGKGVTNEWRKRVLEQEKRGIERKRRWDRKSGETSDSESGDGNMKERNQGCRRAEEETAGTLVTSPGISHSMLCCISCAAVLFG